MNLFFDTNIAINKDPNDRVDAKAKVTGAAKYAAEHQIPNLVHGVLVQSSIAKGYIKKIDVSAAKKAAGVIDILTHKNKPKTYGFVKEKRSKKLELGLRIFHSSDIHFNGQPIALVVADKLEQAQYAASLIKVEYEKQIHSTDFQLDKSKAVLPKSEWSRGSTRGDMSVLDTAAVKVQREFHQATEVHSPMEPHATIALWESDKKLTIYDKNHSIKDAQSTIAKAFNLPKENVTINAEFVGGGFGSGLRVWPHTFAAIMAAQKLNCPVKVVLTRPQMFAMVGYRPEAWQRLTIGADTSGKLLGINHEAIGQTSDYEEFTENICGLSKMMYVCPNVKTDYKILPLSVSTPIWMRAPGEVTGAFALETTMDELAHQLKIDPLQLRLINFAEKHPESNLPWSSNYLKECYETGAKNFGWEKRNLEPRSTKQGDWLVGYGMATGTWSSWRAGATSRAILSDDGKLLLQSAASDMGPGTATTMVKIAMEAIGLPKENIKFELGKSNFPDAPGQGGSLTVASVGSAVQDACDEIKAKLLAIATEKEGSLFKDIKIDEVVFAEAKLSLKSNPTTQITYNELLTQKKIDKIEVVTSSKSGDEQSKYAFNTFGVHFAEVHVHALTSITRVKRFLTCADAGKIINMKTASSQMSGAVIMGIGMTLMEELHYDHRFGRIIGGDFANYHIPVQADVPKIDVHFINKPDLYLNKMGSKGLGEIGLIGAAAAIGNAIFNATGKRLTDLPMTLDKLL